MSTLATQRSAFLCRNKMIMKNYTTFKIKNLNFRAKKTSKEDFLPKMTLFKKHQSLNLFFFLSE